MITTRQWRWFWVFGLLVRGVDAAETYCLSGGQLASIIFGSILGTVTVLVTVFLVFLYLRGRRIKNCQVKDAQFDNLSDRIEFSVNNSLQRNRDYKTDKDINCHCNNDKTVARVPYDKIEKSIANGSPSERTFPKLEQLNANNQSGSEYRTKRKRNSLLSSLWPQHSFSKRRVSYSTESLTSVNEIVRVALNSRDANGLGFNICGNLRDGIFIKSLSNRGPAKECGSICEGDRILSVLINFENMVFEDALTIISYASAYPVTMELQKFDPTIGTRRLDNSVVSPAANDPRSIPNSAKSSTPSKSALFHPLFKSQSVDDIAKASSSSSPYCHVFDTIDANLEVGRAKFSQYSADHNKNSYATPTLHPKSKPVLCSLEVIEETPRLLRRSPAAPRRLNDDVQSISSSTDIDTASHGAPNGNSSPTVITVTAEINAVNCPDDATVVIQSPYAALTYEEQMQILRLSYEENDFSKMIDGSIGDTVDTQTTPDADDIPKSISPLSPIAMQQNDKIESETGEMVEAALAEDDLLSSGESVGHSSFESSIHQNEDPFQINISKIRLGSLTSPSGTSTDASISESDRVSSPEQSKRDSGLSTADDDIERTQYEKLLYFQRQLTKQHEELARLGIHIPMPIGVVQKPRDANSWRKNEQYTASS